MKKTVQFILEIQKILDKKTWIKVKLFYLAVLLSAIFEPIVLVLYKNLLNMLSNQVAFASTIFWSYSDMSSCNYFLVSLCC